jgi:two-component system CheB/CheR fusion protein
MTARKNNPHNNNNKKNKKKKKTKTPTASKKPAGSKLVPKANQGFPIIGIGASAGGLEAIEGFFSGTRSDSNMAFVVVQHLAPGHKSIMDSLLKKYTDMKVLQVKDGMKVKPDCVYLNPPDKDVGIINRSFYLTDAKESRGARLPIDHFFRSLADDQAEKAICIVLSGTGTDGTLGLKAIKGAGGMAMVQDENQARYDNMPRSAIDTGLVDYVLTVEKMFDELTKYTRHPYIEGRGERTLTAGQKFENSIRKIFALIRSSTGHDFSHYKQNTIRRRIERRMAVHQISDIIQYVQYLEQNPTEVDALFKDMLITVTNFFRDPEAFALLDKKVIPAIFEKKSNRSTIRIWVPGCATGEEAYSIAMLFAENAAKLKVDLNVQIFATDIDQDAVEFARQGIYPESIAADVSTARLKRFFIKDDLTYRIKKKIREMVVFATQNLIKDAPFSKLDLVCCRNVLIYMDSILQKRILPLFHYTLNPFGYLFLGTSETIGDLGGSFRVIDVKWKIFQRKNAVAENGTEHPIMPLYDTTIEAQKAETPKKQGVPNIRHLAEKTILQNYAPPCVLINDKHEILYFHGSTEKFLTPPTGEPTFDLLKMVREEIRYKLSTALHRATREKKTITSKGIQVIYNGESILFDIIVRPSAETPEMTGLMLVIFKSSGPITKPKGKSKETSDDEKIDARILALEQEVQSTKEYLQTTIEELETSNEELKSTNEELQSTNEELQSTNEELETSREELQSTNEELETVNSELQDKVEQLSRSNDDLNNLLSSTDIGTIFLDMELCIKRFTPNIGRVFNLINTDIGRPISDITPKIDYPNLTKDAAETLRTLIPKEVNKRTEDGTWLSIRVLPYRTIENVIDGIVITFVDVTETRKTAQDRHLAMILMNLSDAVIVQDLDGKITAWNRGAEKMYGYTEAEALKMNISDIVPEQKRHEALELIKLIRDGKRTDSFKTQRLTKNGRIMQVWLTGTRLFDQYGNVVAVATTGRDITELEKPKKKRAKKDGT